MATIDIKLGVISPLILAAEEQDNIVARLSSIEGITVQLGAIQTITLIIDGALEADPATVFPYTFPFTLS